MADVAEPWVDWTNENAGFPWYMDEDNIEKQAEGLRDSLDRALDTEGFTKDYPDLCLWEDHYLFVYGTLKSGYSNHRVINNKACKYLSECYTTDQHFVLKQTRGGIPAMIGTWGTTNKDAKAVKGELYLVKTPLIPKLDVFEQNGVIYKRLKLRFSVPYPAAKDEIVPAWTYVGIRSAWGSPGETLADSPAFTRTKDGKETPYYCYMGKE